MLNIRKMRVVLEREIQSQEWNPNFKEKNVSKRITIKRKKKMIIEKNSNGDMKLKRRNVIKIEIIE